MLYGSCERAYLGIVYRLPKLIDKGSVYRSILQGIEQEISCRFSGILLVDEENLQVLNVGLGIGTDVLESLNNILLYFDIAIFVGKKEV